jgi:hypothetical protein
MAWASSFAGVKFGSLLPRYCSGLFFLVVGLLAKCGQREYRKNGRFCQQFTSSLLHFSLLPNLPEVAEAFSSP